MDVQWRERRVGHSELVYRAECSADEVELGIDGWRAETVVERTG